MAKQPSPGPSVDAQGDAVVDPTANVIGIVQAEARRQDQLRDAEARRVNEVTLLRAYYDGMLREAEAKRIDAIRAVDVAAAQRVAEDARATAATLAAQVTSVAQAFENTLRTALDPMRTAIDDLRRTQYVDQGGKQQVVEQRGATGFQFAIA